jgi:hypothetical protein
VTADDFTTSVDRLLNQVGHWEQSRWSAPASSTAGPSAAADSPPPTRADFVYALVQRLADLAADAEGNPRRPVPRPGDLTLPDQLRVMSDDLMAAAPPEDALKLATEDIIAARRAL